MKGRRSPRPGRTTVLLRGRIVRDEDGAPIDGAEVHTVTRDGWDRVRLRRRTRTAADGTFQIVFRPKAKSAVGFHEVEVTARGFETVRLGSPGRRRAEHVVEFRLRRGRTVRGCARWVDGADCPHVRVAVTESDELSEEDHPAEESESWRSPSRRGPATFSDVIGWTARVASDGTFAVEGVPADIDVVLGATSECYGDVDPVVRIAAGEPPASDLTLDLHRPDPVLVRVVDDTGAPVAGAVVHAGPSVAVTDSEGRATVRARRGAFIDARCSGHAVEGSDWDGGGGPEVRIRLCRLVRVAGTVLASDGRPLRGADVWGERTSGDPILESVESGADGTFAFDRVPASGVRWVAWKEGLVACEVAPTGPGSDLVLRPVHPGTLRFRIVVPKGAPTPRVAWMQLPTRVGGPSGASPTAIVTRDVVVRDDRVEIPWIAPGRGASRLWSPGFAESEVRWDVRERETADLGDVRLRRGGPAAGCTPDWVEQR